ncbi:MAG TPA: WbqC family protein [Mucilaginibacter sp.]|nr:WbqC family protein [Mucilaginibacter sp.]
MIEKGAVLPLFYLPPVEYFAELNIYNPNFLIEKYEHFPKQTYRNRANIYSPDGVLTLVVPVVKGSKAHTAVKDVKISHDFNWQRLHWMSLQGCYRRSAYFEYYEDEFAIFYEMKEQFLFDYNEKLLHMLLKLLKIKANLHYTSSYESEYPDMRDFRHSIHPKKPSAFPQTPYYQLFEERHGFIKNLSIVDLLFNQGPQSVNYL